MGRHTLPELEEDPDLERWSPCVVLASVKLPVQVHRVWSWTETGR